MDDCRSLRHGFEGVETFWFARALGEQMALQSVLQVKHERKEADKITKTTYSMIRRPLEVALERRRVLGVVAPGPRPRLHHRVEEVPLEEAHTVSEGRLV